MISVPVSEEAASHLGAILVAFNREIFSGFLDEAAELAELGQAGSAVLIAGTVLEYFERSPVAKAHSPGYGSETAVWRELRNRVAHGSAAALSVEQARQMIDGVRQILLTGDVSSRPGYSPRAEAGAVTHLIKGKYAHVPTSSDEFMARKREDVELEERR